MEKIHYHRQSESRSLIPNLWDIAALLFILSIIVLLVWAALQMTTPYQIGESIPITLDPFNLPLYSLRTILRMVLALSLSLLFTFTIGTLAAKNAKAERLIIPMIDILQSVPVLSFLSITIVGFIYLFPGSMLGPECASIFAIFTAQVWNIALGFYQTLKNVPADLKEAAHMFHLSKWQQFWRIEVPCSMSSLIWNIMMSMSASWFFVVASEAISVSNQDILLPGIGSYIALAIQHSDLQAVGFAIIAMLVVILGYDQLIFRPLLVWSEKFHFDAQPYDAQYESIVMNILNKTLLLKYAKEFFIRFSSHIVNGIKLMPGKPTQYTRATSKQWRGWGYLLNLLTVLIFAYALGILVYYLYMEVSLTEVIHVTWLGFITSIRVFVLIILSSLVWVPIGVWIGMRPSLSQRLQPIIQFLASFPANLLFPLVVIFIVNYQLNTEIWTTPLMILGSQWYILFNVIAGTTALPKDLYHVTNNFGVKNWLWWRRFMLPGIFPYYITGAITAAGGAWNASIVAEWVTWGDTTLVATGLGAYITEYTKIGDFHRIALGTAIMCFYVLLFNRLIWQPLYQIAEERYQLNS